MRSLDERISGDSWQLTVVDILFDTGLGKCEVGVAVEIEVSPLPLLLQKSPSSING